MEEVKTYCLDGNVEADWYVQNNKNASGITCRGSTTARWDAKGFTA